jgi:large subunit ribosomal protein L30
MFRVTLVKSVIGFNKRQRGTIKALGLGKIGSSAVHAESDAVNGMIRKMGCLLKVEDLGDAVEVSA